MRLHTRWIRPALSNPWALQVIGGALAAVVAPFLLALALGLVDITFGRTSWDRFGLANTAPGVGSYLRPDTVYEVPVNERYRIAEDMFLSITAPNRTSQRRYATLLHPALGAERGEVGAAQSFSRQVDCVTLTVSLMRTPAPGAETVFLLYTRHVERDCD